LGYFLGFDLTTLELDFSTQEIVRRATFLRRLKPAQTRKLFTKAA